MSPFFVQAVFFNTFGSTFEASLNAYGSLCVPFVHARFSLFFHRFLSPPRGPQVRMGNWVGGRGGTPLNRINSTLSLSLFFKNHTRGYTNSPKGFLWKPAAGFIGCRLCRRPLNNRQPGGPGNRWKTMKNLHAQMGRKVTHMVSNWLQK